MQSGERQELLKRFSNEKDVFLKTKLLESLIRSADMRVSEIAKQTGVSTAYISQIRRISRIPDVLADGYYSKLISASHLIIISRLKTESDMLKIYEEILSLGLSAVESEALVRENLYGIKKNGSYLSPEEKKENVTFLSNTYHDTELSIIQTRIKSKLIFTFKGDLAHTGKLVRKMLQKLRAEK